VSSQYGRRGGEGGALRPGQALSLVASGAAARAVAFRYGSRPSRAAPKTRASISNGSNGGDAASPQGASGVARRASERAASAAGATGGAGKSLAPRAGGVWRDPLAPVARGQDGGVLRAPLAPGPEPGASAPAGRGAARGDDAGIKPGGGEWGTGDSGGGGGERGGGRWRYMPLPIV
jgi:hypothetical protein